MVYAALMALSLAAQGADVKEGYVQVPGGQVYYRVVGHGPKPPLVVLHGGPGVPHNCLRNLDALATDRAVVYYDQLGCGLSDRPKDKTLWTIPRFCQELAAVRAALKIDECVIYGHSWGTILATEAVMRGAKGVKALVLVGPAMNTVQFEKDAAGYIAEMPPKDRDAIQTGMKTGKLDSPAFQSAMNEYYYRHVIRMKPWPRLLQDSFAGIGQDVYETMAGPYEFVITGTLKGYNSTPRLRSIKQPTLLICGEFDECSPRATRSYQRAIAGSKMIVMKGCSHLCNLEQTAKFNRVVGDFVEKF